MSGEIAFFSNLKKKGFQSGLKDLFGKLYADKGYISTKLFEMLFDQGVH
ncbi:MAG: transposase, partial [Petrimonas mucosa]